MSGLDQTGTKFPHGVNVDAGELYIDGVAVTATAASLNRVNYVASTTITFDPPSLTTGAFAESSGIAVTGVALGDAIDLYPPYDTDGIMYQASPSDVDEIKITLFNGNSGTLDLASGTWGVVVRRRV